MDIYGLIDSSQRLSDDRLRLAMRGGAIPEFVVAAELQRRKNLRERSATPPESTVRDDLEEGYASGGFLTQNKVDPHYSHGRMGEADFFGQGALGVPPPAVGGPPSPAAVAMGAAPNGVVEQVAEGSNDPGGPGATGGPASTGNFMSDARGAASAMGPTALGLGLAALTGGIPAALGSLVAGAGILGGRAAVGLTDPSQRAELGVMGNLQALARDAWGHMTRGPTENLMSGTAPAGTGAMVSTGALDFGQDKTPGESRDKADADYGDSKGVGGVNDSVSSDSKSGPGEAPNGGDKGDPDSGGDTGDNMAAGGLVRGALDLGKRFFIGSPGSRTGAAVRTGLTGYGGYHYLWPGEGEQFGPPRPPEGQAQTGSRTPSDGRRMVADGGAGSASASASADAAASAAGGNSSRAEKIMQDQEEPRGLSPVQLALIQAGLGMMSSGARTPLAALGEAGGPAMATYLAATRTETDDRRRRQESLRRDQQHADMMQRYDQDRQSRERLAGITDSRARELALLRASRGSGRQARIPLISETRARELAGEGTWSQMSDAQRRVFRETRSREAATEAERLRSQE